MRKSTGYIIGGIVVVLGIYFIVAYNGFVKKDVKVKQQWSEVQNAYQRRLDLIPNVVNVVKGGADFEKTTLQKIAEARASAASGATASNYNKVTAAQNEVASATNRLLINVENYPQLQGAKAFRDLQVQLEGTERRVKFARKDFNAAVADYNNAVRNFPGKIVASITGFPPLDGFAADAGADKAVEINFNK